MRASKGKIFPIIFTVVFIIAFIYLFATAKQPLVVCDRKIQDDLGIIISEELESTIDGNEIAKMVLTKTITLPDKYLTDDSELENVMFELEKSYQYLGDKVSISKTHNKVISVVEIDNDETIILNNIEFFYNDELEMRINSNTKSSEVITFKIGDKYSEGKLKTRLKNNGYSCK